MLCLIPIAGGLLIMMEQHDRSEALFYYFRLEDQVPETHLLRLIEKHISFEFVRERLKDSYSEMGRPSIDPELLLRILRIGYLYGVTSERKLVEELRMHLAWRWFTGLDPIAGGLLIMMGQHDRSEALFYYFRLEDQVPETHLLRLIEKHISFEFVRER